MMQKIIDIYENIYNQELLNRDRIDNKFSSKIKLLFVSLTLIAIQSRYILFDKIKYSNRIGFIFMILLFIISLCSISICLVSFYKCFFRVKKNYLEMPIDKISKDNAKAHYRKIEKYKSKKRYTKITNREIDLLLYMKNSYMHCANHNEKINIKRSEAIIVFDNAVCISLICSAINYYILFLKEGLSWIQF